MDTRRQTSGARVMAAIEAMMVQAGSLDDTTVLTDCIILTRTESLVGAVPLRDRWHPMGVMDDLRERGLIEQHNDDIRDEDRQRRGR